MFAHVRTTVDEVAFVCPPHFSLISNRQIYQWSPCVPETRQIWTLHLRRRRGQTRHLRLEHTGLKKKKNVLRIERMFWIIKNFVISIQKWKKRLYRSFCTKICSKILKIVNTRNSRAYERRRSRVKEWRKKRKRENVITAPSRSRRMLRGWLEVINIATPSRLWPRWLCTPDDSVNRRTPRVQKENPVEHHRDWKSDTRVHFCAEIRRSETPVLLSPEIKHDSLHNFFFSCYVFARVCNKNCYKTRF